MQDATSWKSLFRGWPASVDRRGVIVTSWGEQVPFETFAVGEELLMVDRSVPDTLGARKIILPYANISGLKFTDVVKTKAFVAAGFEEPPPPMRRG